jgi:hypothetical protein
VFLSFLPFLFAVIFPIFAARAACLSNIKINLFFNVSGDAYNSKWFLICIRFRFELIQLNLLLPSLLINFKFETQESVKATTPSARRRRWNLRW